MFTPWLNGERSPVDDHTIRGGFHNLSLSTTRGRPGAGRLRRSGLQHPVAARCGGAVRRPTLRVAGLHRRGGQLRRLGPDPRRCHRPAGSARWPTPSWPTSGAPGSSPLLALGRVTVARHGAMVEVRADLRARTRTTRRCTAELYPEFVNLYKRTKQIHRRLNPLKEHTMESSDLDFVVEVLEAELRPYRQSHHTYRQTPGHRKGPGRDPGRDAGAGRGRGAEMARRLRLGCGVPRRR